MLFKVFVTSHKVSTLYFIGNRNVKLPEQRQSVLRALNLDVNFLPLSPLSVLFLYFRATQYACALSVYLLRNHAERKDLVAKLKSLEAHMSAGRKCEYNCKVREGSLYGN